MTSPYKHSLAIVAQTVWKAIEIPSHHIGFKQNEFNISFRCTILAKHQVKAVALQCFN